MTNEHFLQQCSENPLASLSENVYSVLYEAIVTGSLPPGTRLNLAKISCDFNLSRTPVADACEELVKLNFLYKNAESRGYYVTELQNDEYQKLVFVRRTLEVAAISAATRMQNTEYIKEMYSLAEQFKQYFMGTSKMNVLKLREIDSRFHELIFLSSKNPYLIKYHQDLMKVLQRYLYYYEKKRSAVSYNSVTIAHEHLIICKSFETGIPLLAEEAMLTHMDTSSQLYA